MAAKVKRETIKVADATIAQMQKYALESIGDTFPDDTSIADMRSKIKALNSGKDEFAVSVDEPPPEMSGKPPKRVTPKIIGAAHGGDRNDDYADGEMFVEIQVQTSDKEGGEEPIQIAVNGVAMLIPRGVPAMIKVKYLGALANAVQSHPIVNDNLEIVGYRKVHTYPFSILNAPNEIRQLYGRPAA